ncbi:MAG TPA: hypothetical protein VGN59_14060 [Acidimicrobiia bacterium]
MASWAHGALPPNEHSDSLLDVGELGPELQAWREELCVEPSSELRRLHLLAMDRAATTPEPEAQPTVPNIGISRRRRVRSLVVPIAASFGVVVLSCGLASAGVLPGPAQTQAARLAGSVGWSIPDGSGALERSPSESPHLRISTRLPGATATTVPRPTGRSSATATTRAGTGGPAPATAAPSGGSSAGSGTAVDDGGSGPPGTSSGTPGTTTPGPDDGGSSPGSSGDAPGRSTDTSPGKSGDAPGHNKAPSSPGSSGKAPGHAKD